MALDYDTVMNWKLPEIRQTLTQKDTMLYALGLGLGADPMDEKQLRFVYEKDLLALPTMAVVLAPTGFIWKIPELGADWKKLLHGEQGFELAQAHSDRRRTGRPHAHRLSRRQGQGQGRARLHRAHDFGREDRRDDRHAEIDEFLARRWRFWRTFRADARTARTARAARRIRCATCRRCRRPR